METPEKNDIPNLLLQWKEYKASGFASPPGLEASALLGHGSEEPTCWWTTREKLADADYNLGAGQWCRAWPKNPATKTHVSWSCALRRPDTRLRKQLL